MIRKTLLTITLLVMVFVWSFAESITGKVIDESGEAIVGANVVAKGVVDMGTITDFDGNFTLNCDAGTTLIVTYVGYKSQDAIAANGMIITLREDSEALDEIVVVGYGTQKKVNLTGAVSTVDVSKQLENKTNSDIASALQGAVPGLTITNSTGSLDATPTIQIRGLGTLSNSQTSSPLIVVDGVPMDDISYLNANDIESISVLKDAASTSIYGTRAAFGVLLIQTKGAKKQERISVNYSNNFSWANPTVLPNYPTVSEQGLALYYANTRIGDATELFGMYIDTEHGFFDKADAWLQRHGGKTGYREMVYGDDYDDAGYYADWDVIDIMYRQWRPAQNHNLSVSGSSQHINYYLSFGYDHQEGVLKFNPSERDKFNVNLNLSSQIAKWLKVGARVQINKRNVSLPNAMRNTYQYMLRWGSYFEPLGYVTIDGVKYDSRNAIAYLKQAGERKHENLYTRMSAFAQFTPVKGLNINVDYTYNIEQRNTTSEGLPVQVVNTWGLSPKGGFTSPAYPVAPSASYIAHRNRNINNYALNVYATYEASVNKAHNFKGMVGGNVEEETARQNSFSRTGLLDANFPESNLAIGNVTIWSDFNPYHRSWGTAGVFARFNYDYKGIALLELNGRFDGSSRFPEDDRWAFFPSGSVGYRISEHQFFNGIKDKFSNLKLRASLGQIGNEAIGDNMFISTLSTISASSVYWVGSGNTKLTAFNIPTLVSSDLTWERIQTLDVGIDLGFFNNDLNISFDWYQRDTKDMLAPSKTLPAVLGTSAPYINAGELRTRGWELSVDYRHTFRDLDDLTFYGSISLGDYQTEVTKWDNDNPLLNTIYSGKKWGDIWGFETDRFFKVEDFTWNDDGTRNGYANGVADQSELEMGNFIYLPGDVKFIDKNGDGVIDWGEGTEKDHGDLVKIGNTTPRYQYGIRIGASWKGIDLDLYFQGVGKREMWQTGESNMIFANGANGIYETQTDYYGAYDRQLRDNGMSVWGTKTFFENIEKDSRNLNAFYPLLFAGNNSVGKISNDIVLQGRNNYYPQTKYLLNAAYCRFKTLTVGYTLPTEWTKKAYIQKFRLYFTAENLCELFNGMRDYPIDPEITGSENLNNAAGTWGRIDPMNRTLSFGIQLSF